MDLFLPLRWLTATLLSTVVAITLAQIAMRYLFNAPLIWSEELVRFMTVWMTFLGSAAVCYDGRHLNVDVVLKASKPAMKRVLYWLNAILSLGFLAILGWHSIIIVQIDMMNDLSSLPLTLGHLRLAATVSSVLMIIAILARIFYLRAPEYRTGIEAPAAHIETEE